MLDNPWRTFWSEAFHVFSPASVLRGQPTSTDTAKDMRVCAVHVETQSTISALAGFGAETRSWNELLMHGSSSLAGLSSRQHSSAPDDKPRFLITIDTEGDDQWRNTSGAPTKNSLFIPRFQELCEDFHLKPTYLTNYEMACCPDFQRLGRRILNHNSGEIGMHLHAWNSPPFRSGALHDGRHGTFLTQCSEQAMREKIAYMTALLEDTFGVKPRSHRAGRWAFDERYARLLEENGYEVDCSVTPGVSWRAEARIHGVLAPDYTRFRSDPYWLDLSNIAEEGHSRLLEVPVTIFRNRSWAWVGPSIARRALSRFLPESIWLRPNGRNLRHMLRILQRCLDEGRVHAQFMLHSSELMPGGSPVFDTKEQILRLYKHLRVLFKHVADRFQPATLSEFYAWWRLRKS